MKQTKKDNLLAILLSILLSYLIYTVVRNELLGILSDYNGHTYVYLPMFTGESWIEGWKAVPYCIWHLVVMGFYHILNIPLEASAAYVSVLFSLFSYFVVYWMLLRYTAAKESEVSSGKAAVIAFGFSVVQPLYLYWMDAGTRFLGSYSMNPIHNPTQMSVNPFSLLCFCLVYDIWSKQADEDYKGVFFDVKQGLKKPYFYLAVILFISAMTKPTFAEMFIPAVGIIMLIQWMSCIRKKDGSAAGYFKHCLHMLYCAIPALSFILAAALAYFFLGGSYEADGSLMITKWMEVWSLFTENVALSILLGMAFPLFVVWLDVRFFWKDLLGRLALVGYGVGFLEAALLGEGGSKLTHADFIWPMMSGMLLMWMASTLRLLVLEKTQADTKGKGILIDAGWFLFFLHVLCGLLYIKSMIFIH